MPVLTQFCDIFGAINETAFNNLVTDFQNQRPSLFNYGTISFVRNPQLLCDKSLLGRIDPDVRLFNNPIVSQLPLLGIPGYTGIFGLEYCFQFSKLLIDFQPSNSINLPPELNPPLKPQTFAIQAKLCAGLDCPNIKGLLRAGSPENAFFPQLGGGNFNQVNHPDNSDRTNSDTDKLLVESSPTAPFPFNPESILCFCLDVFAVLRVEQGGPSTDPYISLILEDLRIPGIKPTGLEKSIECYIKTVLTLGILPKVKLALHALVFNIAGLVTIGPTPVSASVPFNPSIEKDQIEVFLTLN